MNKILIGIVAKPQGIKGEVKINPITDDISRFKKLKYVYLNNQRFDIENVSIRGNFVVVKLKGINTCEEVERFRQANVEIDRADAVELQQDEYFMVDLIDSKIVDEEGVLLGVVKYIDRFGANFVLTVKDEIANSEFMFPFIEDVLVKVDTDNKLITINREKLEEVKV